MASAGADAATIIRSGRAGMVDHGIIPDGIRHDDGAGNGIPMMGHSHALLGLGSVAAVNAVHPFIPSGLFAVGGCLLLGVIGGLVPDIDAEHSEISEQAGCLGWFARLFFKHRGLTHEPALAALLLVLCWRTPYLFALAIGYTSHLVADGLTKGGLPLFLKWRLHLLPKGLRFSTNTLPEYLICVAVGVWLWLYSWPIIQHTRAP